MARSSTASLERYLTTQAVAEHFDTQSRTVLRMIREGRLKAEKVGWMWLVDRKHLPKSWPPPVNKTR